MATRTISVAGGNWDAVGTWDEGIVPIAGDAVVARSSGSGNLTVNVPSACASVILTNYTGTLTFNSTLTLTSTCTFVAGMTIAGTAGTLILSGAATHTSGGKTLTCALTFSGAVATRTFADSWTVNGLVTIASGLGSTLNGNTLHCVGGITQTGTSWCQGTTKISIEGGTWSSSTVNGIGNSVDLAGNVTVSGSVVWGTLGKILKYVSGTITTTGSTLVGTVNGTYDTHGVTWNNITWSDAAGTYTLNSDLEWSGTFTGNTSVSWTVTGAGKLNGTGAVNFNNSGITLNTQLITTGTMTLTNAMNFLGSAGFTVGTLVFSLSASNIQTLSFGATYTVTTALSNVGTTASIRQALKSNSAGNKVIFNLTPGASCNLNCCDPTDVNSLGGATILSLGGVITNTDNWLGSYVTPTGGGGSGKIVRPKSRMRM